LKVCIYGAGAIGGRVAVHFVNAAAAEVSLIARGAHLQAIRATGLTLHTGGKEMTARPAVATDDPSTLPPQDLLLVTLKAHAVPAAAGTLARLLAPQACAVFLLNGIPWWWNHGLPGNKGHLPLLDPEGALWRELRARTLGCVVNGPCEVTAPGVIVHTAGNRWTFGEPDGSASARLKTVIDLFNASGLVADATELRSEMWRKLSGNAANNTVSALTRLTASELADVPGLQAFARGITRETLEVAAALGWDLRSEAGGEPAPARPAANRPRFRTSMLQDVLAGRPLEVEALVGQTQAFAREAGVPVPCIDAIVPLLRGLDRSLRGK
jgi:2-dehydropantoate 2-reductase